MICKSVSGLLPALGRATVSLNPSTILCSRLVSFCRASTEASTSAAAQTAASFTAEQEQLYAALSESLKKDPHGTLENVAKLLTPEYRQQLLCHACKPSAPAEVIESAKLLSSDTQKYVDELFEAADRECPKGFLSKSEFQKALFKHQASAKATDVQPPSFRSLMGLAIASGIPFVGFGFLDNVIMITAGEEIDLHFGAKLGLSTMAAAGLGNLFADVAGIGFANTIEQFVRKLRIGRGPPLTKAQANMRVTTIAKAGGATFGVMIGCLLGLAPLLFMDKGRRSEHKHEVAAAS